MPLLCGLMFPISANSQAVLKHNVHTWESVGEVIEVNAKTVTLRQKLKLSEATWSLLPGAVAEAKQLTTGDQVHAKGSTLPDGTYDTKRIFLIAESSSRQTATGGGVVQGADHGAPESQQVPREVTDPGGRPDLRAAEEQIRLEAACRPAARAAPKVRRVGCKARGLRRPRDFFPEMLKALSNRWRRNK